MTEKRVGVVMGSESDWSIMKHAVEVLEEFEVSHEYLVVSAHRTPDQLFDFAENAADRGLQCIIAGAGGAAHLPGMLAAKTRLPSHRCNQLGPDSRWSDEHQICRDASARLFRRDAWAGSPRWAHAALFAIAMLANDDEALADRLRQFRQQQRDRSLSMTLPPEE